MVARGKDVGEERYKGLRSRGTDFWLQNKRVMGMECAMQGMRLIATLYLCLVTDSNQTYHGKHSEMYSKMNQYTM